MLKQFAERTPAGSAGTRPPHSIGIQNPHLRDQFNNHKRGVTLGKRLASGYDDET